MRYTKVMIQVQENASLVQYSTMRLGGSARYLVEIASEDDLLESLKFASEKNLKIHVVGTGSNTIFQDEGFHGLVIVNRIIGVTEESHDDTTVLTVGAGENWDDIVARSVNLGHSDIAVLSMIPGTVGAAPVQNIGAYGQQISDSIVSVRAYDTNTSEFSEVSKEACEFSYRHSRFNSTDKDRFIITSIKMRLCRKTIKPPLYADIEKYFTSNNIVAESVTPQDLRAAVIHIRSVKLPDPSVVANCGSFFKNPVITNGHFQDFKKKHPEISSTPDGWSQPPYWNLPDNTVKLAAGWLVEQAGFKDYHDAKTGMATWKNQSLVLINESAKTTVDLTAFKEMIVSSVYEKFGITLKQEPELVAA